MNPSVKIQRNITFLALGLFFIRILAWRLTQSVAIFTDALDSIINVATGVVGWYSVWLAAKPRDRNHPYGHGKIEFVSSGIEGALISLAGIYIIIKAIANINHPDPLQKLDIGILLLALTGGINLIAGLIAMKSGKKNHSAAVDAAGHHLITDTYSTVGIILGLVVLKLTGWLWLDVVIAFIIAAIILYNGFKVLRGALAGIMDEADLNLLKDLISCLNENRKPQWIGIHNFRIIKNGSILHIDGHLTLPWYYTVQEAHEEVKTIETLIRKRFGDSVELFLHEDYCEPYSCEICELFDCPVRRRPFKKRIEWNLENVLKDEKHHLPPESKG